MLINVKKLPVYEIIPFFTFYYNTLVTKTKAEHSFKKEVGKHIHLNNVLLVIVNFKSDPNYLGAN